MERNKLLSIALAVSNIIRILTIAFIILFTFVAIHSQFNPDVYNGIALSDFDFKNSSSFSTSSFETISVIGTEPLSRDEIQIKDATNLSLIILYLQAVVIMGILVLILHQISQLISSVKALETFRESNCTTFRKIGRYCFLLFIVSGFRWLETDTASFVGIYVNYMPLLCMLGAFILAEIFKEGNKLYEAEQLTI